MFTKMLDFLKTTSSTDNTVSSRRVILLVTMAVSVIVNLSIVILSFLVLFLKMANQQNVLDVFGVLLKLTIVLMVFILLLAGIVTWQNINDTLGTVKGLPASIQQFKQTVQSEMTTAAPANVPALSTDQSHE